MARRNGSWDWTESLGGVRHGDLRPYRIRRILFGMVEDHCHELGLFEGDTVRCLRRDAGELEVRLATGTIRRLPTEYAWFVEVETESIPGREARPG